MIADTIKLLYLLFAIENRSANRLYSKINCLLSIPAAIIQRSKNNKFVLGSNIFLTFSVGAFFLRQSVSNTFAIFSMLSLLFISYICLTAPSLISKHLFETAAINSKSWLHPAIFPMCSPRMRVAYDYHYLLLLHIFYEFHYRI